MIKYESILSAFDEKGTLLKWLKKVEKSLNDSILTNVEVVKGADGITMAFKFKFKDGTGILTPFFAIPKTKIFIQNSEPTISDNPQIGDLYLNNETFNLYQCEFITGPNPIHWLEKGNLKGPQGETGPTGATGPAGPQGEPGTDGKSFNWTGAWVSGNEYRVDDVVENNGSSYICIQDVIGSTTAPSEDTTNWNLMAQAGQGGVSQKMYLHDVRFSFDNSLANYPLDNTSEFNGNIYIKILSSSQTPFNLDEIKNNIKKYIGIDGYIRFKKESDGVWYTESSFFVLEYQPVGIVRMSFTTNILRSNYSNPYTVQFSINNLSFNDVVMEIL